MFTPRATFNPCYLIPDFDTWHKADTKNPTWLEMRSSHTDSAIWIALALWVTEMAVNLNLSRPYTWFAWVTASLNTCSYLFWLRTAPMFTILGSQPPRTQEQENNAASRSRRIVWRASRAHGEPQCPPFLLLQEARVWAIRLWRIRAMSSVAVLEFKKNPRCEIHTHCGDLFMVPGSFKRWHLREPAFTAAFLLIPPVKSGCRQTERESRILHKAWQQKSVMRLVSSASLRVGCCSAAERCPWCWQLCALFYARPRTSSSFSRWRSARIKTLRCHKQSKREIKKEIELFFHLERTAFFFYKIING